MVQKVRLQVMVDAKTEEMVQYLSEQNNMSASKVANGLLQMGLEHLNRHPEEQHKLDSFIASFLDGETRTDPDPWEKPYLPDSELNEIKQTNWSKSSEIIEPDDDVDEELLADLKLLKKLKAMKKEGLI